MFVVGPRNYLPAEVKLEMRPYTFKYTKSRWFLLFARIHARFHKANLRHSGP